MAKIELDKYYTPPELAKELIDLTYEVIGEDNITSVLEPSAGSGSFSLQIPNCEAYDISPCHDSIVEQDYLKLESGYQKGRLIIGNPPFGEKMNLAASFFKKSVELGDYIAFILPISQLNNTQKLYEFDLIYSRDLGEVYFTDRNIRVCFNIYRRPENGVPHPRKKSYKLKDIQLAELRGASSSQKRIDLVNSMDYDIAFCTWGTIGKKVEKPMTYSKEVFIKVLKDELREPVVELLSNIDWKSHYGMVGTPNLAQWQIYKALKENIDGIE